jgi:hypothetical protein
MARSTSTILGSINRLAWNLIRRQTHTAWGDAFRAAKALLLDWRTTKVQVERRLRALARRYARDGETGRALNFARAADAVAAAPTYSRATKAFGVKAATRLEIAAAALPYGSERWGRVFGRREVRAGDLASLPAWGHSTRKAA